MGGGRGGGHACGFLFNFSKVTENAIITIKLLIFFHIFSDVAIGSESSPSLNRNIIDCYVILLMSTFITINNPEIQRFCLSCLELNAVCTEQLLHEAEYDVKSYADQGGYPPKLKA